MTDEAPRGEPALRELVPAVQDGERIDRVVALLADVSRNRAGDAIDRGEVNLDGTVVEARSRRVVEGEELVVADLGREADHVPQADPAVPVAILHEDDQVVVVDKPAGLVVHPGAGNLEGTLVNGLLARYPDLAGIGSAARPGIVHRLDLGTSGALAVARTEEAYASLVGHLADRTVGRRYPALTWAARVADRRGRRADRTVGTRPDTDGRDFVRSSGPNPLRTGAGLGRSAGGVAAGVPPGDRPYPPDPGPPVGHRPPAGG